MKKIILTVALCLVAVASFAQGGKSIYKKYSDEPGVSAVYISSAMFKMMGSLPEVEIADEDVDITPAVQSLTGMYVLESENAAVSKRLLANVKNMVDQKPYELLMETKDEDERTFMYAMEKDGYIESFVILTSDEEDCTFVCFEGRILQDDFQNLLSSVNR